MVNKSSSVSINLGAMNSSMPIAQETTAIISAALYFLLSDMLIFEPNLSLWTQKCSIQIAKPTDSLPKKYSMLRKPARTLTLESLGLQLSHDDY